MSSDLTLIAVGTPFDGSRIDLTYVKQAARSIGAALADKADYHVVVVKSTVVPGTTDGVVRPILEEASGKRAGRDFGVGMNPEFLTEGEAIGDFMFPDRIVLGGIDPRSQNALAALYEPFPDAPRLRTNNSTAEMIKYASNALLATMISFSNELANLGSALGDIDAVEVMEGLHLGRYLNPVLADGTRVVPGINGFLMPGCGFGGSCLPKDVSALIGHGSAAGTPMPLLQAVIDINRAQPDQVFRLLTKHLPSLRDQRISVLGLAFRPDTNDMRESPAIPIIHRLLAEGAVVSAYDPAAREEARRIFGESLRLCGTLEEALRGASAVVLVTRWKEFLNVPELLARMDPPPVFVDGRRMLHKESVARYEGIGL
jgi:UDPglucose 6-dehydrogenase/GDP-mannose 6-dehydrogenase